MKKLLAIILVISLLCTMLCACTAKKADEEPAPSQDTEESKAEEAPVEESEEEPDNEGGSDIPNPMELVTREELAERTGLDLAVPEDAENAQWVIINSGDTPISEVDFDYNGISYCYRAQPTAELKAYDMSGMFYNWRGPKTCSVGGRDATAYTCDEAGYVSWLDIVPGINYNLSSTGTGDALDLLEVANLVFKSVQGSADEEVTDDVVDYTGSFADENNDTIQFTPNDNNGYDVEVSIYRLSQFTGAGYIMDGAVEMDLEDPNGGILYGIFFPADDGTYTLMFTESEWELLESGSTFEGFTANNN